MKITVGNQQVTNPIGRLLITVAALVIMALILFVVFAIILPIIFVIIVPLCLILASFVILVSLIFKNKKGKYARK